MYDEYEDDYPPLQHRPQRRYSLRLVCFSVALLGLLVCRIGTATKGAQNASQQPRVQTVKIMDWQAVDGSIKQAVESAYLKAEHYAEAEVQVWIKELHGRVQNDFLPWWFSYPTQQEVMLRAVGYRCLDTALIEAIAGKQKSMEGRLEKFIGREFNARVLQPKTAQLRIEKITRKSIEVYLYSLQEELNQVQVEYEIHSPQWEQYLGGLPETVLMLDANRSVPLVMKAITVGSGGGAAVFGLALSSRVRGIMTRRVQREFVEGGIRFGGRFVAKGLGWWLAGACVAWDLADHHRLVRKNLPVLRSNIGAYLEELQEQVLRDQRCGILVVLQEVQRGVLVEVQDEP